MRGMAAISAAVSRPEGDAVEEADGIDRDVAARSRLFALLDEMIDPVHDLLVADDLGRTVMEASQVGDIARVGFLRALGPAAHGQVPDVFCS